MNNQSKYMIAGTIIAGVGTIYALQKNINVDLLTQKIEENKSFFLEVIEELISLTTELLQKLVHFIKKIIKKIIFQLRMNLSV